VLFSVSSPRNFTAISRKLVDGLHFWLHRKEKKKNDLTENPPRCQNGRSPRSFPRNFRGTTARRKTTLKTRSPRPKVCTAAHGQWKSSSRRANARSMTTFRGPQWPGKDENENAFFGREKKKSVVETTAVDAPAPVGDQHIFTEPGKKTKNCSARVMKHGGQKSPAQLGRLKMKIRLRAVRSSMLNPPPRGGLAQHLPSLTVLGISAAFGPRPKAKLLWRAGSFGRRPDTAVFSPTSLILLEKRREEGLIKRGFFKQWNYRPNICFRRRVLSISRAESRLGSLRQAPSPPPAETFRFFPRRLGSSPERDVFLRIFRFPAVEGVSCLKIAQEESGLGPADLNDGTFNLENFFSAPNLVGPSNTRKLRH